MVAVGCADDNVFQGEGGARQQAAADRPVEIDGTAGFADERFGMASDLISAENMMQQDIQADGGENCGQDAKGSQFQPEFSGMQQTNHDKGTE